MKEDNWFELWRKLVERNSRPRRDGMVEKYKRHARKKTERPDPLLDFVLKEMNAEDTVLEIGPGTGRWTIPLARTCRSLTAVEPTSAMADMLRENLDNAGLHSVEILSQSWEDASPEMHDVVICAHGMYGSPDLAAFVRKMERCARKRCYLAVRLTPADGIMAELSLKISGCRHDSPDAVIVYNALYTLGIYANVLVEDDTAHWINASLEDAIRRAKKHLHLGSSQAYDELISSTLNRRLSFSDGVYTWPDGMRSALLWWSPVHKD
ncbi:Methyltransferase domain-containing protein [Syntrophus gentianae]|uniref:Methyltransferase domain-containing protein n=1 Tax=Syntrophus gentianae TaxID=43775 RepID=A0A1H8B4G2_9BACT|nr:class I SAM-dependent methyltransferase [Syntrophus gentianae]SEM77636.1 Methyltransferase domain-containing protein [Syntrophus gentianae]